MLHSKSARLHLGYLAIPIFLAAPTLHAQQAPDQITTLHVYANLVQIPVLILTPTHEKLRAPVPADRFSISFNGGPSYRPTYARLEGDDPLDLAIVLDTRTPQADLLPKIDQEIADLAPNFLHPHDHVSIFAIDCAAIHLVKDVSPDPAQLKNAVDNALSTWARRKQANEKPACSSDLRLWDDLAYVTTTLAPHTGRRTILAITDGDDGNSLRTLPDLVGLAENSGVAIFGISRGGPPVRGSIITLNQNLLSSACEASGGMLLSLYGSSVEKDLQRFVEMLRDRYILEFRRPPHPEDGRLVLDVTIDKLKAFIRPAGDGVPLASPAESAAPTSQTDPSAAPPPQDTPPAPTPPAAQ